MHEISRPQKFPLLTKFSTAARWHGSTTRKKVFVENTNVTLDDTTTRAMDPVVAEAPVLKKISNANGLGTKTVDERNER